MNKIFTPNFLQGFKKIFLVAAFAFAITANQAYTTADTDTNNLNNLQVKTVKCYPNPAVSFVNFEFSSNVITKNYSLLVYSFTGKKMYETNISNLKITLSLTNDFYRGIYVYQLRDKAGRVLETGKFQVTK
jgi:type IX secretion system substrate protein